MCTLTHSSGYKWCTTNSRAYDNRQCILGDMLSPHPTVIFFCVLCFIEFWFCGILFFRIFLWSPAPRPTFMLCACTRRCGQSTKQVFLRTGCKRRSIPFFLFSVSILPLERRVQRSLGENELWMQNQHSYPMFVGCDTTTYVARPKERLPKNDSALFSPKNQIFIFERFPPKCFNFPFPTTIWVHFPIFSLTLWARYPGELWLVGDYLAGGSLAAAQRVRLPLVTRRWQWRCLLHYLPHP